MPSDERPRAKLKTRKQVREKIRQIKIYIDEQRGNDPEDMTGFKVVQHILEDLNLLRYWPKAGRRTKGLEDKYRQRAVGPGYIAYYYIVDPEKLVYLIDLRHGSQKSLKPATLRKYKSDTLKQSDD